jgi:hypothetical protein
MMIIFVAQSVVTYVVALLIAVLVEVSFVLVERLLVG